MRYFSSKAFEDALRAMPEARKRRIKKSLALAAAFFETGNLPHGLGMKPLGRGLWEIRAGLYDRVVFLKDEEGVGFLLAGSHDEVRRYLKRQ